MKYHAPIAGTQVNATNLIQGSKSGRLQDSQQPIEHNSNGAGYGADE